MSTFTPTRAAVRKGNASAIRSLLVTAHINLRQARSAKKAGRIQQAKYHFKTALECRADAHSLR